MPIGLHKSANLGIKEVKPRSFQDQVNQVKIKTNKPVKMMGAGSIVKPKSFKPSK